MFLRPLILALLALGAIGQFLPPSLMPRAATAFARWPVLAQGIAVGGAIVAIDALGPVGVAPFIYFQF